MKLDRLFYTAAGAIFLLLTIIGFQRYIFAGKHFNGTPIDPSMLATVVAHSSSIFAWYLLFFVQSMLIPRQNRRLHMKLGRSVLAIAPMIALTGPLVATLSLRHSLRLDSGSTNFDWNGPQFLLIMYAEVALYATFVAIGVLNRKRPRIHRPMMLMASLSILSGATARIPLVNSVFGLHTWMALFGPVISLGLLFLLVRWVVTRRFESEPALAYSALLVASVVV